MGRTMDESLLSTASTLVDSCSTSFNESYNEDVEQVDESKTNSGVKPLLCRGRITDEQQPSITEKLKSPTTTAINLEITESANDRTDRSEKTTASKLERLRARNRRLRKQGSQKIEEARASLRKSRSVAIEEESQLEDDANPPPYPPPSLHNGVKAARIQQEDSKPTGDLKKTTDANEFSAFLRRSNSVIDRLSAEMAMAGNIINQSVDGDTSFNDTGVNKINDFASNLCVQNYSTKIGRDEKSIRNEENSIHNISVGEDWDQTTISATLPDTPASSAHFERSLKVPPPRPPSQSGLPPPEVVVKRITPRAEPPRVAPPEPEISFAETATTTYPPRSTVDRHLRQRPPSMSSMRGDCASMYNTNQKCEKLAMENDCLKRQLELLESRHRDSQMKLMQQMTRKVDEETQEATGSSTSKTPKTNAYSFGRKKKHRWSDRRRIAMLLLVAPVIISSTIWFYQSVRMAPTSGSGSTNGMNLNSMMRDGVLNQSLFGRSEDTLFENSADINSEETDADEEIDEHPVLFHEAIPEYQSFENPNNGEPRSGKKKSRFHRILSRIKFSPRNNAMGAWYENHRKIATERHHAEL